MRGHVEGPGTDVSQQNATQPVEAPGTGMATQPVEVPGTGLRFCLPVPVLLPCSLTVRKICRVSLVPPWMTTSGTAPQTEISPGMRMLMQELSEEASYRDTIKGVRLFMGWYQISEFDRMSSADDNPFAGSRVQPKGKVSVKLLVDDWLCRKMEKLNLTVAEGYPSRKTETAGLLRDQFVNPPRSSRWYDMHADKKDSDRSTVCSWSLEPAKLNSAFSRVTRCSSPAASHSRALSQVILRRWERPAREQSVMCNQAARLSRCLTRVQDTMSTQLKNLYSDKGKGKSSERTQQAVDELEYLVTFNRSISKAMARTMQDLSEGVFISVANFTLAHRDSYLEYLHAGVKQDTLPAL